jgi:hypothetical protein
MSKRIRQPRATKSGATSLPNQLETCIQYAPPYPPDYKRNIERFFRLQSFPEKATKKTPRERTKSGMRLRDLMALFDERCRQVDDQRKEHRRTLRKSGRNGK